MSDNLKYNVLWVDDKDDKEFVKGYKGLAQFYELKLVHYTNWQEAKEDLISNFNDYSAIILDAHCKMSPEDVQGKEEFIPVVVAQLMALFNSKNQVLPWYILSAGIMSNFDFAISVASYNREKYQHEWGEMLYVKDVPYDDPQNVENMFERIQDVAKNQINNVVVFRHQDVFKYIGEEKLIDKHARDILRNMLCSLYSPKPGQIIVFSGNPLRKVMEYIFRAAYKKGFLPIECFERDNQVNLLESNRYMSGMTTRHSKLHYGQAGPNIEGKGGDTIFPDFLGQITRAIIEFGSIDSHTNEVNPYTIDDKDLELTEDEKELFFSYVLQLCHVIKFFGKFVQDHPNIEANKAMKKVVGTINLDCSRYEGLEGKIEKDNNGYYHVRECLIPFKAGNDYIDKRVILNCVRENTNNNTKLVYPYFAKYKLIK